MRSPGARKEGYLGSEMRLRNELIRDDHFRCIFLIAGQVLKMFGKEERVYFVLFVLQYLL